MSGLLVHGPFDYQLVKQTIEWKSSARFDEPLEISVRTKHLGNTSFTLAFEFRLDGRDEPIATAETVYVLVDAHSLAKSPLPADVRETLAHGGHGALVDHADCTARHEQLDSRG